MVTISRDLLGKQKKRKNNLSVRLDLYPYGSEFFKELESRGFIERLDQVKQLGLIKVPKSFTKSRYDYIALQLYLHRMVSKLQKCPDFKLDFSYGNFVKEDAFGLNFGYRSLATDPSVAEAIQILCLAYNLGHCQNTFTASRALVMAANEEESFRQLLLGSTETPRLRQAINELLDDRNYHRFHLVNSLLVLETCDQDKESVRLAQALLYAYLYEEEAQTGEKLLFIFRVFRKIRELAYLSYDLLVANTPLTIDITDELGMLSLLREILPTHKDKAPASGLLSSINELLNDSIYNEESSCLCHYRIAKTMAKELVSKSLEIDCSYLEDLWLNHESCLNRKPIKRRDYDPRNILKLIFTTQERDLALGLVRTLEIKHHVRASYYDRPGGETAVLIAMNKKAPDKVRVAFGVLRILVSHLRQATRPAHDSAYLLATKFFLYYFFDERTVFIEGTLNPELTVFCSRGRRQRLEHLEDLLRNNQASEEKRHEIKFLYSRLKDDSRNDTSLIIPASIIVYDKKDGELCELDGLIIHPNRKEEQIIFLEAKLLKRRSTIARTDLSMRFKKLGFSIPSDDLILVGNDCYYTMTIK